MIKKTITAVLVMLMMSATAIAKSYEYIIPPSQSNTIYDGVNQGGGSGAEWGVLIVGNGETTAVYDYDGVKLSKDYTSISFDGYGNDGVVVATRGGVNYLLDRNGQELPFLTTKKIVINPSFGMVGVDEGNNDGGGPRHYYQGDFALYDYWGQKLTSLPYSKTISRYKMEYAPFGFTADGRMFFIENGKVGAWDLALRTVIEPKYYSLEPFSFEEVFIMSINIAEGTFDEYGNEVVIKKEGLVDKFGNELTEFKYDYIQRSDDCFVAQIGSVRDIYDLCGTHLLTTDKDVFVHSDAQMIQLSSEASENVELVDFEGREILSMPKDKFKIGKPSDGMIAVKSIEDDAYAYFDYDGNQQTDFKYKKASAYNNGLAFVEENDVCSVINKSCDVLANVSDWSGNGYKDGLCVTGNDIIDAFGNVVYKGEDWSSVKHIKDNVFVVTNSEGTGVIKVSAPMPSDWAVQYVMEAAKTAILPEKQRVDFKNDITRLDFCELAYEFLKYKGYTAEGVTQFTDVNSEAVSVLADLSIVEGKSETAFCPDDKLTREEAATILYRIYCLENEVKLDSKKEVYADDGDISQWAYDAVYLMRQQEIMSGYGDDRFGPRDNYTKEQAIATIVRMK